MIKFKTVVLVLKATKVPMFCMCVQANSSPTVSLLLFILPSKAVLLAFLFPLF